MSAEIADQHELALLVEYGEANTMADSMRALSPEMAEVCGARTEELGGAVLSITGRMDFILFNRVVGLGLREPATEALVDNILDRYRPLGVRCMIQLSPAARPAELPSWLEARGLQVADKWAKVYRGPDPPPEIATNLRVEQIGPERADLYAAIAAEGFAIPVRARALQPWFSASIGRRGWTHFLAYDGDVPVTVGALYVQGGIGSLFGGATLPSARRRGGQGAIMAARIHAALAQGCRWIATETGEDKPADPNPSYHNMLRTGFQLAYLRPNYVYTPATAV